MTTVTAAAIATNENIYIRCTNGDMGKINSDLSKSKYFYRNNERQFYPLKYL